MLCKTRSRRRLTLALAALFLGVTPSMAQKAYPNQPVKLIVPFSAGSMTDILARAIGDKLATKWGQSVIVENRPGVPGTAGVARSPNDGYTLMLTSNGHTVLSNLNKNLNFDPVKDFVPIAQVASIPSIMIVPPDSSTKTLKDLIDKAKANPGKLSYGSAGVGSATGIAAELFKQVSGTQLLRIPHRGMPEAQTSIIRADTDMAFTFFNVGGDLIQGGKMRALAVTGDTRLPQLPDVPTFKEAGLPQFTYDAWFGIFAPAGTPKEILDKVSADIIEALKAADMKARFEPQAVVLTPSSAESFARLVAVDTERYAKIIRLDD